MKIILTSILIITFTIKAFAELPPDKQMPFISAWDDEWTKKHVDEITKGAKEGIVEAQLTLASIYEMGDFFNRIPGIESIEKNDKQAIFWLQKAADQNNWLALNNLAVIYYHGRGVEEDHGKALELLKEAWASKEEQIAANLAFYYINTTIRGNSHPNYIEASKWYKISAEAGNWFSQYEYGKLCENGLGALKDKVEALKWYYLSSAKGHVPANQAATFLEARLEKEEIKEALGAAKQFLKANSDN
jgi:TPR repeat protein